MKNLIIAAALFIVCNSSVQAQEKTREELKAEREVLKSELKSKEAEERKAKFEKLSDPKESGIASVDQLAVNSSKMLLASKELNKQIPEIYKRTVGESVDGVTDVTVKKPTLEELLLLSGTIATQLKAVSEASEAVTKASADVKNATMMQAPKASKSLNYSKDVLALVTPELSLNMKVISNLIATIKSSNNY